MGAYSSTPLAKKLGYKENFKIHIINKPQQYFQWFDELPADLEEIENPKSEELDFVHLFCHSQKELEDHFLRAKKFLKKDASLWVSWPKKSSKIKTDISGDTVRTYGLKNGLVDVKVASVTEIWSGLKFMYRFQDR